MLRITNHRRFTANHTWHVDCGRAQLFVKANPNHVEAAAERAGHARLHGHYPVPRPRGAVRLPGWTVLAYERWPHLGTNMGLLVDEIVRADVSGDTRRLDRCLTAVLATYRQALCATLRRAPLATTISKLYADRAAPGGRLDQYYRHDRPWALGAGQIRPSDLAGLSVVVNSREHRLSFASLVDLVRERLGPARREWGAITQGDPTDLNIGWSAEAGPVWFDYDTAGHNSLPGEFACFLLYQRLHGAWLTPRYNPTAFHDHPAALTAPAALRPEVHIGQPRRDMLTVEYDHRPSRARQHVMRRYLVELVEPMARHLGVEDALEWLRPYLVLRLLGVYNLADLEPADAGLSVALLAETLNPDTSLTQLLGLTIAPASAR